MSLARALWHEGPARARLRTAELPSPPRGWCQVAALFSAVSPGTERLVAAGRVPPEVAGAMRCPYMEGEFPFPVKYGYSLVGRVVRGPAELRGRIVHVLHPHQDRCNVRVADVRLVPEGVPAERATLAANLETAVTAVWDSRIVLGERALVVGFGVVGSLVARLLAAIPGVEVDVVEREAAKRDLARRLGFTAVAAPAGEYDLAFGASGSPAEVQTALDALGAEGRLVEVSWLGSGETRLALGGSFHNGRKRIAASQVSSLPPFLRGRWDFRRRTALVFSLLRSTQWDEHVSRRTELAALPDLFAEPEGPGSLSITVRYPPEV
ncbi:MAG TPA: zinc-binding alcohol dehydrogenase [Thermoanaerobaculia bacterium]|nr:zinc-binding alcohol dehydrogenase [Thermoanaerobaculia bacterium]